MQPKFLKKELLVKRVIGLVLLGGDLTLLAFYCVFFVFSPPPSVISSSRLYLEMLIAVLPTLLLWALLGWAFSNFDYQKDFRWFVGKSLLVWLVVGLFSGIVQALSLFIFWRIVLWDVGIPFLTFWGIGIPFIAGLFIIGSWRIAFKTFHVLVTQKRFPILGKVAQVGLIGLFCIGFTVLLLRLFLINKYSQTIFSTEAVSAKPVAIVFGAGVYPDGTPSGLLVERLDTVAALFHAGKVSEIILSGDGRTTSYDESGIMYKLALKLNIPAEALILDNAGYNTYATCYRAKEVFGKHQAILISQPFHLVRMLFICNALGVESVGVASQQNNFDIQSSIYWTLREIPATAAAWWSVYISRPVPVQ